MKKQTIKAILAGVVAFMIWVGATSCKKKDPGCYTCKVYDRNGLADITEICDEAQVQPFKDAYKNTGMGVSCSK